MAAAASVSIPDGSSFRPRFARGGARVPSRSTLVLRSFLNRSNVGSDVKGTVPRTRSLLQIVHRHPQGSTETNLGNEPGSRIDTTRKIHILRIFASAFARGRWRHRPRPNWNDIHDGPVRGSHTRSDVVARSRPGPCRGREACSRFGRRTTVSVQVGAPSVYDVGKVRRRPEMGEGTDARDASKTRRHGAAAA